MVYKYTSGVQAYYWYISIALLMVYKYTEWSTSKNIKQYFYRSSKNGLYQFSILKNNK